MSLEAISGNAYPGRGILIGKTQDGTHAVFGYFIMGRSVNSRNRIFVEDGDIIRTEAYDTSKLVDPSLIIYNAVRQSNDTIIVTNGDQTDTIYDFLQDKKTFEEALRTREFEPDAPNFTPRISGVLSVKNGSFTYKLSILKSDCGEKSACIRSFFEYAAPICGRGHLIHTYKCDGNPIPSFVGEPVTVSVNNDIDTFSNELWDSLDANNRVSLAVRFVKIADGSFKTRIINKNH